MRSHAPQERLLRVMSRRMQLLAALAPTTANRAVNPYESDESVLSYLIVRGM